MFVVFDLYLYLFFDDVEILTFTFVLQHRDIVAGLAHLHDLRIVHRDLKPRNVLISAQEELRAKLSDMGVSKRLSEDKSSLSPGSFGEDPLLLEELIFIANCFLHDVNLSLLGCRLWHFRLASTRVACWSSRAPN